MFLFGFYDFLLELVVFVCHFESFYCVILYATCVFVAILKEVS